MKKYKHHVVKRKIHIFCNGELAEPNYFKELKDHFKISTIVIHFKRFQALSPWDFIKKVVEELETVRIKDFSKEDGDQCWCVFDVDNYLKDNKKEFERMIKFAGDNNVKLAWSNECFELWYLLHFQAVTSSISRKDFDFKLSKHFNKYDKKGYKKNDAGFFLRLLEKQELAIKNAKKLSNNLQDNPSTSIWKLIEEIKKLKGDEN